MLMLSNEDSAPRVRFSFLFGDPLCTYSAAHGVMDTNLSTRIEIEALDSARERVQLRNALETHKTPIQWTAHTATVKNFLLAFRTSEILHLSGHGEEGFLALESEVGELELVSGDRLVSALRGEGGHQAPTVVFLSVCFGASIVPAFEQLGIPYIIAPSNSKILDRAAVMFGEQFYLCLLCNKLSVPESFATALARLNITFSLSDLGSDVPFVLHRNRALGGKLDCFDDLFESKSAAHTFRDGSPQPVDSDCPPVAVPYIGRRREQQEVFRLIKQRCDSVVAVAGPRGIGKSELLIGALSYLIEREQLNCSKVVYIDAKSYQTSTDTAFALLERLGVCSGAHKASLSFSTFASSSDDRSALKLEEAKYELEVLLRHMQTASHKYMVFAFDNVDTIGDVATLADLFDLLRRFSNVVVCYTARKPLNGPFGGRVVDIDRLNDSAAILLFSQGFRKVLGEFSDSYDASLFPRLNRCLRGNPGAIVALANKCRSSGVQLAASARQGSGASIRRLFIELLPEVMAEVLGDGIPETNVRGLISEIYGEVLRGSLRALSELDMKYLTSAELWKSAAPGNSAATNSGPVFPAPAAQFLKFFRWFPGLLECLEASRLWAVQPDLLVRLVNKHGATRLLKEIPMDARRGVFVVGVSESSPSLTITYGNAEGAIVPCLIRFERTPTGTRWGANIGSKSIHFDSLSKLLMGFDSLVSFFPSIRKADVLREL